MSLLCDVAPWYSIDLVFLNKILVVPKITCVGFVLGGPKTRRSTVFFCFVHPLMPPLKLCLLM